MGNLRIGNIPFHVYGKWIWVSKLTEKRTSEFPLSLEKLEGGTLGALGKGKQLFKRKEQRQQIALIIV